MHEPTILAGLLVVASKSSRTLDNMVFQKLAVSSVRVETEVRLILRARGNRLMALSTRAKVSCAEDGKSFGVFARNSDRVLARMGTKERVGWPF